MPNTPVKSLISLSLLLASLRLQPFSSLSAPAKPRETQRILAVIVPEQLLPLFVKPLLGVPRGDHLRVHPQDIREQPHAQPQGVHAVIRPSNAG